MMEIKFRGKRVDNGEWVYGYYLVSGKNHHSPNLHFIYVDERGLNLYAGLTAYKITPESIGQFTGLTDKNGVEIYKGDICMHNGKIAQIVFWEGAFIFNVYYIHDYSLTNFACCRTFEVIGNIYENPKLL